MNAIHFLIDAAEEVPDRVALRCGGASYTYRELDRLSARFAAGLRRSGIRPGRRVALLFPNSPEFVICYLGIVRAGAIAVSLNPALRPEEVNYILSDCSVSLLLVGEEARQTFAVERAVACEVIVCNLKTDKTGFFRRWLEDASPRFEVAAKEDDDPLAILYTSGTTGFPKGATLTHGNIAFTARSAIECFETGPTDRLLLMVPVSHCFGQNLILNHALAARATIVLVNGFEPAKVAETIEQEQVTIVFAVPAIYALLLEAKISPRQLASVRCYHSGAAALSEEVATAWLARFSVPIQQGYGLTETSPFASYNTVAAELPTSIGRPIAGVEMRIVDEHGQLSGVDGPGEILIHGPNVMKGYWNQDGEMRGVDDDGWLHSGDLAVRDEAGNYYLVDRIKDVINVSGLKVFPAEVERVLSGHPAVLDAGVFGAPDLVFGERVSARVVLREGKSIRVEELAALCRDQLAPFKVPTQIAITDLLPRNGAGKLLRRVLRQATQPNQGDSREYTARDRN